jgi:3-phenylpropionate/trans-cinnamate dioxygenase ferredoxin subunit
MNKAVFVRACPLAQVPADGALGLEIDGEFVCLVRTGGEVFALGDTCPHAEVALSEGEVYGHTVECWMHGSRFDVRTGKPTAPPAIEPVPVYPVRVDGDDVYVDLSGGSGR